MSIDYDPTPATARRPFNLMQWIDDHRHELTPPVANKQVWREADMIIMMVGGGNERNDFHDDPKEEFFYQIKGDMNLVIWPEHGAEPHDMPIGEGEIYLEPTEGAVPATFYITSDGLILDTITVWVAHCDTSSL